MKPGLVHRAVVVWQRGRRRDLVPAATIVDRPVAGVVVVAVLQAGDEVVLLQPVLLKADGLGRCLRGFAAALAGSGEVSNVVGVVPAKRKASL